MVIASSLNALIALIPTIRVPQDTSANTILWCSCIESNQREDKDGWTVSMRAFHRWLPMAVETRLREVFATWGFTRCSSSIRFELAATSAFGHGVSRGGSRQVAAEPVAPAWIRNAASATLLASSLSRR
jgi:hypothetical protein